MVKDNRMNTYEETTFANMADTDSNIMLGRIRDNINICRGTKLLLIFIMGFTLSSISIVMIYIFYQGIIDQNIPMLVVSIIYLISFFVGSILVWLKYYRRGPEYIPLI